MGIMVYTIPIINTTVLAKVFGELIPTWVKMSPQINEIINLSELIFDLITKSFGGLEKKVSKNTIPQKQ